MKFAVCALTAALAICLPMYAHHGNAAYKQQIVTIKEATVTKFAWVNPHSIVTFDVKDDNGKQVHWAAELGSPSALTLIGWAKASTQPGDMITVYLPQAKTGNSVGRIDHIVLADGSSLRDSAGGGDRGDKSRGGAAKY